MVTRYKCVNTDSSKDRRIYATNMLFLSFLLSYFKRLLGFSAFRAPLRRTLFKGIDNVSILCCMKRPRECISEARMRAGFRAGNKRFVGSCHMTGGRHSHKDPLTARSVTERMIQLCDQRMPTTWGANTQ